MINKLLFQALCDLKGHLQVLLDMHVLLLTLASIKVNKGTLYFSNIPKSCLVDHVIK